ncbi:MAG: phosphotransferase [Alphaproteobacteria bacterium]|nr:phosphotransferase [Alphaproteobacteria bacterium]
MLNKKKNKGPYFMNKKDIPQIDDFIQFLSNDILKTPIISIYQFKRGASSFNYLVTLKDKKLLVKLAWKHKKEGVERLVKIIKTLAQNNIPTANVISFQNNSIFSYKNSYGFVLEYIDGKSLPACKVQKKHLYEILNMYKSFQKISFEDEKILIPAYDFKILQEEYLKNCNIMLEKTTPFSLSNFLLKMCQKELQKIGESPLKIEEKQKNIIHGDFHHNNILFKENKLQSFLDFEDVGYGYATEDLLRFALCLTARQHLFYPSKKSLINCIDILTTEFSYSYEKWMVGLNSFTLQKMKKVFVKPRTPSIDLTKKLIQLIVFMRKYHFVKSILKKKIL